MEFTNEQKLIISLLTDIHAKLAIEDSLDPDFVQRMVSSGQGWALEWKYPGLFEESNDDPENVKYVADVLEMWSALEDSFKALDANGRKVLSETAGPFGRDVKFPGFDGNNEHELLSIARIFVDDLDRWSEFSGRVNNSHMRTTDGYRRMLAAFKDIRAGKLSDNDYGLLGAEHLGEVLSGRRHPENG
ncbi:YfbU family protein [Pseudomonas viridiflava]|uniref:YfbU family protein n=1 Tax=Pseudomonas viridiflava TaxID=33069 RepID=UPI002B1E5972|nr:YfbU family protein [Pseudomonas viridiflava]